MRAVQQSSLWVFWLRTKEFLFTKHRNVLAFSIVILSLSLLFPVFTYAQSVLGITKEDIVNGIIGGVTEILLVIARFALDLVLYCLDFFLRLAAYNGFIDAPPVVVGWFMVRDLANMFFIVALLVIAFSTMLGLENYAWKKSLVKLIAAAILINFSRLIIGVLIDASQIITLTFLNAVEGAAGGNLITMFHLDKMLSISTNAGDIGKDSFRLEILAGGMAAVVFSLMALFTIAAYAFLMLVRVLILWMLIILSPLAFVLSSLPQTQGYASEFWGELTKYLIIGPLMTFFLWLAFATLGSGDIAGSLNLTGVNPGAGSQAVQDAVLGGGVGTAEGQSVTVNAISRWENLSSFFIAIGFLLLGIERVQKIGVRGTDIASSIISSGKKITKGALKYGAAAGVFGSGAGWVAAGAAGVAGAAGYKGYKFGKFGAQIGVEKLKQGYYSTLGKGDLQRAGSLGEYQATTKAIKDRLIAEGSEQSSAGGDLARAQVASVAARKRADESQKLAEAGEKKKQFDKEWSDYQKEIEKEKARFRNQNGREMTETEVGKFATAFLNAPKTGFDILRGRNYALQASGVEKSIGEEKKDEYLKAYATQSRGGTATNVKISEDRAYREKMKDYAQLEEHELYDTMKKVFAKIRATSEDAPEHFQAVQDMTALTSSALEGGKGQMLAKLARDLAGNGLHASFKDIDDAGTDITQLMLALQGSFSDKTKYRSNLSDLAINNPAAAQKYEEEMKAAQQTLYKNLIGTSGDPSKASVTLRNLNAAMNRNASSANALQWKGQLLAPLSGNENDPMTFVHAQPAYAGIQQQVSSEESARKDQRLQQMSVEHIFRTEIDQVTGKPVFGEFKDQFAEKLVDELRSGAITASKAMLAALGESQKADVKNKLELIIKNRVNDINDPKIDRNTKNRRIEQTLDLVRGIKKDAQLTRDQVNAILDAEYKVKIK